MKTIFKFFIILFVGAAALAVAAFLYLEYGVSQVANAQDTKLRTIEITRGMGASTMADKLQQEGIIQNPLYFLYYAWRENATSQLKAGTYSFSPSMRIADIVSAMEQGATQDIRVTIPEGFSSADMERRFIAAGLQVKQGEFVAFVDMTIKDARNKFDYPFLLQLSPSQNLEGYLFPDTYDFAPDATVTRMVAKMLENFQDKAIPAISQNANLNDIVTLASILEKEVQTYEDMRAVSGVLNNRLKAGMPLQVDASLAYITGKKTGEITDKDKKIDSPYNTYVHKGLPPGPITNPGLKSIQAAQNPQKNDYWYYLSTSDGRTIFSKTLEEHNANKAKYLR
ncbi:MAG: endolytic transglycosylase MltG [Candidatus Spechtbacteria bacterium]|nr:endolytic transglycosylase MltG [Candidatus Spechtbacteria bacterium]